MQRGQNEPGQNKVDDHSAQEAELVCLGRHGITEVGNARSVAEPQKGGYLLLGNFLRLKAFRALNQGELYRLPFIE